MKLTDALSNARSGKKLSAEDWAPAPRPQPFEREEDLDVKRPHEGALADVLIALNVVRIGSVEDEYARLKTEGSPRRGQLIRLAAAAMEEAARIDWRRS